MSLRSEERQLRSEHRKLLRQRRRALEAENFTFASRCGIKARRVWQKVTSVHRRRVGTFRPSMLDGHAGNVADEVKRFIALAYKWADDNGAVCTVTSTTGGTHATFSWHKILAGRNKLGRAVDLIFATVDQMADFQAFAVEHTPDNASDWLELFGPAAFYVKDGVRIAGHFPDHGDHLHGAPKASYRR